jgi:type II secretory pathway pseudopilin PulG
MRRRSKGLSFLELLIITSCISLVAAVALPAFQMQKGRELIPELVLAAASRIEAVENAIEAQRVTELSELDAGMHGIPPNEVPTATRHGAQVVDGRITMVWKLDSTFLQGTTYVLSANALQSPIFWESGGSCVASGYC